MHLLLRILTLVTITLYSMSGVILWGGYFLRADAIAETSCVNPATPSCHGKCHMAKLTSEDHDSQDTMPIVELTLEKPLLFLHIPGNVQSVCVKQSANSYGPDRPALLPEGMPQPVFHPPLNRV